MAFIGANMKVAGVVQGVGFRFWCHRKANEYGLFGYVANLPDGSVEIEVEGDRGIVEEFIKTVRVGPTYAHIADLRVERFDKPKGYRDFSIEYK
jgi:acylphosphatase